MDPSMPIFPSIEEMRMYAELSKAEMHTLSRKTKWFINIYAILVLHAIGVGIKNIYQFIYG